MLLRLLCILGITAVAETVVLVALVRQTGFLATVAILLAAGLLGTALAKRQGFRAWTAIRGDLAAGRPPGNAVLDGAMVLFAGLLLLLPGLLTDVCGILLLIPRVRAALRPALLAYLSRRIGGRLQSLASRASGQGEVIDAEFRRADAPLIEDHSPR